MSIESLVLVANDKGGTISTLRVEGKRFARVAVSEVGAGCGTFAVDRANDLVGIVNGIDTKSWDPATDPLIASAQAIARNPSLTLGSLAAYYAGRASSTSH